MTIGGGPIQGGRVIGETDKAGREIVGARLRVGDLFAALYEACGIDFANEVFNREGKFFRPVDNGLPIKDLLA